MRQKYKIIFSRLLVLIMVIGSIPSAMAIESGQNMLEGESQGVHMLFSDANDMEVVGEHSINHIGVNATHSTQCFIDFLQDFHAPLLVTRSEFRQRIVAESSVFYNRYPDLLIRPPKS